MTIKIARSNEEILRCFSVMQELRPHIEQGGFVEQVRRQEHDGYRLAFVFPQEEPVAVVGYRISENLAWGRFLYVDDLVTLTTHRSQGYGTQLLAWLGQHAVQEGCGQLHLDSGFQREDAHRFYLREGMQKASFHFSANRLIERAEITQV